MIRPTLALARRTRRTPCSHIASIRCVGSSDSPSNDGNNDKTKQQSNNGSLLADMRQLLRKRKNSETPPAFVFEKTTSKTPDFLLQTFALPPDRPAHFLAEGACQALHETLESLRDDLPKRGKKSLTKAEMQPILDWLYMEEPLIPLGFDISKSTDTREEFVALVNSQKKAFCEKLGLVKCAPEDNSTFVLDERRYTWTVKTILKVCRQLANRAQGRAVPVLLHKVLEAGIQDGFVLATLLYVSVTFGQASTHQEGRLPYAHLVDMSILDKLDLDNSTEQLEDDDKAQSRLSDTDAIAVYHDYLHDPTEQSSSIRIRLLVAQGNVSQAENLLDAVPGLRLRTAVPVLRLRLELGQIDEAMALYRRMRNDEPLVHLDHETYTAVLAGLAVHRFSNYEWNQVVQEMSEEILDIPLASAKRLYDALAVGCPNSGLECNPELSLGSLTNTDSTESGGNVIARCVSVDPKTGICPVTGVNLRLIQLQPEERLLLRESILKQAKIETEKFKMTRPSYEGKKRKENSKDLGGGLGGGLESFMNRLRFRIGAPFTAIVDGANVGYYMQNYDFGTFNFHQILFVMEALKNMGETPLIVLPRKYTNPKFTLSLETLESKKKTPTFHRLSPEDLDAQRRLVDSGNVFVVPYGILDDFYWILASVADQTQACQGKALDVKVDNPDGRWPGARPVLISNDQLRDHKLEMMEPLLFRRWRSNYVVNYDFAAFVGAKNPNLSISFTPADVFSREIQCNEAEDGRAVWHFPLRDTENDWLCIRTPT